MSHDGRPWPRRARLLVGLLIAAFVASLAAEPFLHKHVHFDWEGWPAFHGWFGFAVFVLIVVSGWPLRRLLGRREDYYEDD